MPSDSPKAIILAAGKDAGTLLTKHLGDRTIVECVLANLSQIVPPADIYLVVAAGQAPLANGYHHVVQESPLGTGHAVLQAAQALRDYRGNLLILYGDTPLVRPGSLLGLLNRHNLRQAHLTLLTAVVDRPLPYGRIIRNAAGQIMDIIEETRGVGRRARHPRAECGRLRGRFGRPLSRLGAPVALPGRRRIPPHRLRARADPLRPARRELPHLRPGRGAGHQLRRGPGTPPSSSSKSACSARAARRSRTW